MPADPLDLPVAGTTVCLADFKRAIAEALDWNANDLDDGIDLVRTLGLDSLGMLILVAEIEALSGGGRILPLEYLADLTTVRDAYLAYLALSQMPDPGTLDEARPKQLSDKGLIP